LLITLTIQPLTLILASTGSRKVEAEEVSFGVMPTLTQIVTQSGRTVEAEISVKNNDNESITLKPLFQPFTASPSENGEVSYQETVPDYLRFIRILADGQPASEVALFPHEEKSLRVQIQVPENESSKDYYFSLILFNQPKQMSQNQQEKEIYAVSSISGGVASHFLVTVNPSQTTVLKLTEFSAPPLSASSPVPFRVRLRNEGKHYARVFSEIEIENLLGMKVETVKSGPAIILANSSRSLNSGQKTMSKNQEIYLLNTQSDTKPPETPSVFQKTKLFPGIYRATLSVGSDSMKSPIKSSVYFTVLPVELLFSAVVIILVLLLIKSRIKKRLQV